jgi:hypothetical protein
MEALVSGASTIYIYGWFYLKMIKEKSQPDLNFGRLSREELTPFPLISLPIILDHI